MLAGKFTSRQAGSRLMLYVLFPAMLSCEISLCTNVLLPTPAMPSTIRHRGPFGSGAALSIKTLIINSVAEALKFLQSPEHFLLSLLKWVQLMFPSAHRHKLLALKGHIYAELGSFYSVKISILCSTVLLSVERRRNPCFYFPEGII